MALSTASNIKLSQVITEIAGVQTSLAGCFTDANPSGFDPTYSGGKDRLSNFRGYNDNPVNVTILPISTIRSSSAGSFTITVTVTGGTAAWTATDNQTWITLSGTTSSSSSATFTVNYTANTGGTSRFGTVTVAWSGTNRTCSVIQQP